MSLNLLGGGSRQPKNLVEFRAGKMNLQGKMVHPDKRKGLVYIYQSDDNLTHFCWKDRKTGTVEDVSRSIALLIVYGPSYSFDFISWRIGFDRVP